MQEGVLTHTSMHSFHLHGRIQLTSPVVQLTHTCMCVVWHSREGQGGRAHTHTHLCTHMSVALRRCTLANGIQEVPHYCLLNIAQGVRQMHTCVHVYERVAHADVHACMPTNCERHTNPGVHRALASHPKLPVAFPTTLCTPNPPGPGPPTKGPSPGPKTWLQLPAPVHHPTYELRDQRQTRPEPKRPWSGMDCRAPGLSRRR